MKHEILRSVFFCLAALTLGAAYVDLPAQFLPYGAVAFAGFAIAAFLCDRLRTKAGLFWSRVNLFEGDCIAVRLGINGVAGSRGDFRCAKKVPGLPLYYSTGKTFPGRALNGWVYKTEKLLARKDLGFSSQAPA